MGRNNKDFDNLEFKLTSTHPTSHELEAVSPTVGDVVGYMRWNKKSGEVEDISVDAPYRRQGIATQMWNHAKTLDVVQPKHSSVLKDAGKEWATKVGD